MRSLAFLSLYLFAAHATGADAPPSLEQTMFFESHIRPMLIEHCRQCHGPKKRNGGLRLDGAAAFRTGGDTGPLIDQKAPEKSLILGPSATKAPRCRRKNCRPPRSTFSPDG